MFTHGGTPYTVPRLVCCVFTHGRTPYGLCVYTWWDTLCSVQALVFTRGGTPYASARACVFTHGVSPFHISC